MITVKDSTFAFNTNTSTGDAIAKEINDLKAILVCVAMKLDKQEREQLITELTEIDSPSVNQWVHNLKVNTQP